MAWTSLLSSLQCKELTVSPDRGVVLPRLGEQPRQREQQLAIAGMSADPAFELDDGARGLSRSHVAKDAILHRVAR